MSKFERAPQMSNVELNPNEVGVDAGAEKKLEGERTPEELEKLKTEEGQEQEGGKPEPLSEEQLKNLAGEMEARSQEMTRLTGSIEETRAKLNEAREGLGLPPIEEEPSSAFFEKDKLEKLRAEQEVLEKQRAELISQQEKERLIREEKEKILQEKLDELFKEFEGLRPRDFESIFKSGKTPDGRNVESKSMGSLEPEVAQSLAKAFREGMRLLPKTLAALPGLLKKIDEDLTKEATERVDRKLEEEKRNRGKEREKEEKPEEPKPEKKSGIPEGEISPGEITFGQSSVVGGSIENHKT